MDFSSFLMMMHRQMQQEDPQTEILEALRMTDKQQRGYIQASELRAKLTKLGEKLTNKEGKITAASHKNFKLNICRMCKLFFTGDKNITAKRQGEAAVFIKGAKTAFQ